MARGDFSKAFAEFKKSGGLMDRKAYAKSQQWSDWKKAHGIGLPSAQELIDSAKGDDDE